MVRKALTSIFLLSQANIDYVGEEKNFPEVSMVLYKTIGDNGQYLLLQK